MIQEKPQYSCKLLSSLEKVFPDELPVYRPECMALTALRGETVSFQFACTCTGFRKNRVVVAVDSPLAAAIRVRSVETVPVGRACNAETDDNYLKTVSGLYPDLLRELLHGDQTDVFPGKWRSLWIDVSVDETVPAGTFPIKISLLADGEAVCAAETSLKVFDAALPPQTLMHTEWFHADCLADYYQVPVFSEAHWDILKNFLTEYAARGCNMILTPLFTPALDTAMGGERTTVQLIDVFAEGGGYRFDFARLKRWVDLCQACGIRYFEMCHLFSQWGAIYPPKIMGTVDGKEQKIFGWHTPAIGEYTRFLRAFLPQLTAKLREWGIADVTYFHLSDEPRPDDIDTYRQARESVADLLSGFHTFDALSSYAFYQQGLVDKPVPGNNEIDEFLAHGLTDMWTYYCVGQYLEVSNRFMSMPSLRNRILGIQLYKYQIIGFLQWGYNFYNNQFSLEHINPYQVTDAGGAFPSGDAFLVYPGADRHPEESLRMMVLNEALNDLRSCQLLESLTSRDFVLNLLEGELAEPLTFKRYPKSDMYLLQLRSRINREIAARC
jgi:hypothetical protein